MNSTLIGIIAGYFFLINLVTFIIRGIDKRKAIHQKWRIKEKTLLIFVALGGMIGALLGMEFLRHKTIKGKFLLWFWLWAGLWILGIIGIFAIAGK